MKKTITTILAIAFLSGFSQTSIAEYSYSKKTSQNSIETQSPEKIYVPVKMYYEYDVMSPLGQKLVKSKNCDCL